MGFLDKAKEQAGKLAEKAKEGAEAGKEKLGEVQTKRKIEGLLHDLGAVVYQQRTGQAGADSDAEIDRLVAEVKELEAQLAE